MYISDIVRMDQVRSVAGTGARETGAIPAAFAVL